MDDYHSRVYYQEVTEPNFHDREWRSLRRKILKRDHFTCVRCDLYSENGYGLSIHHIIPRDEGGGDYWENLITLCLSCHDFIEIKGYRTISMIIGSFEGNEIVQQADLEDYSEYIEWHALVYGWQRKRR